MVPEETLISPHYSVVAYAANGQAYGYVELVCDKVGDIEHLPSAKHDIAVGSKCTCLANGTVYVLNNARSWVAPGEVAEAAAGESESGETDRA